MNRHAITEAADQAVTPGPTPHPGGWIRRNLLEPLDLSVTEAARRMGISRPTFAHTLDGKHAVTRDLAYKLEALTGVDGDLLVAMQAAFDAAEAAPRRARYAREIERVAEPAQA